MKIRHGLLLLGLLLLLPGVAQAEEGIAQQGAFVPRQIFALLFLMLGPMKILLPFVTMTAGTDAAFRRKLATRAVLFSAAALMVAGLLGNHILQNFSIPIPVLALTGGLVLFLVALQAVLQQFEPLAPPRADRPTPHLGLAINPLAFPTIVTPYGIAAMIIFVALAEDDPQRSGVVAGLVLLILAIDWLAMLYAHVVLKHFGTALQVFSVVLSVTQVALGLKVILQSLSRIGVFAMRV